MKDPEKRVRKSLKYSILDGAFYSAMLGLGESFLTAFAVFLKASNIQLGLLTTLPQALGSLSVLLSNTLLRFFRSRKRLVCVSALLEGLMYVPIALVYFLGTFRVHYLIALVSVYWVFGMILTPAWNSWMGDLVNERVRGAYFGRRNRIAGFTSFFSLLAGGVLLQRFARGPSIQYLGFTFIFGFALLARIISLVYLTKQYEPEYRPSLEPKFGFIGFLRRASCTNYGLFVLYLCFMDFSVYLAVPFFAAYMLKDLGLSYLQFTLVNATALIAKYLLMPFWGRAADHYGAKRVLGLAGFLMPLAPLLWLFSRSFSYLLLIQAYSGFAWAGFEISSFSFIFDTTKPQQRATCIAYYNVLSGVALLSGGLIGSLLTRCGQFFWSRYYSAFLVSCVLRYVVSLVFVPKLKEVREIERISYRKLLYRVITTVPTIGLIYDLISLRKRKARKTT